MDFKNYIPHQSFPHIEKWITELNIDIRFVSARKTKLGDYQFRNNQHFITVNNNLNKYADKYRLPNFSEEILKKIIGMNVIDLLEIKI